MKKLLLSIAAMLAILAAQAQLTLVQDIHPTGSADPTGIQSMNGKIYFNAADGTNGRELWSYDPGTNTAQMVYNIGAGVADGLVNDFSDNNGASCVLNGKLYFAANDQTNGFELWVYDGTGTPSMIADIYAGSAGSSPSYFRVINNKIYFSARNATIGTELFVYDPANNTAQAVTDIAPGPSSSSPYAPMVFNNKLYFRAYESATGSELYVYDPATNSASMVGDIQPGVNSSSPGQLMVANNKLFFMASTALYGTELYSYSGTGLPVRLTDLNAGPLNSLFSISNELFNGKIYMAADNGTTGFELYTFDVATNTSQLVYEIQTGAASSYPTQITNYANKIYFNATSTASGVELWKYDGITPPVLVQDLFPGTQGGTPLLMKVINDTMYLNAQNSLDNYELYRLYDAAVSVNSPVKNVKASVYPVPATDAVNITFNLTEPASITTQVYDVTGRMVYSTGNANYAGGENRVTIPCKSFPAGNYQFSLTNREGVRLSTGKIVKQ